MRKLVLLALLSWPALADVSFSRDVLPVLSDRCFACHGPDSGEHGEKWRGGLRLDTREGAFANLLAVKHAAQTRKRAANHQPPMPAPAGTRYAIVPGKPEASRLIARISSDDPDEVMPPPDSHLSLSPPEKDLLRRWIAEGANWDGHWAFQAPTRPTPPTTDSDWPRNPIDRFVLAQLQTRKLQPAPEAELAAWLRRITQDLTGLPPSLAEIDAYLANPDPERDIDRLLDTDAYAERMAAIWLDNARYADSNGYQFDNERSMWPWRDWVIQAYRQHLPYDRFVTQQLAGDLLPNPSQDQLIATGFNRNHGYSIEGGISGEEYRVMYANDKTTTAGTLFLGLTLECTRCHDHKYDPLSMADYYSFYAFFNSSAEAGAPGENGRKRKAAPPYIEVTPVTNWQLLLAKSATAEQQTLSILDDHAILASGPVPNKDRYRLSLSSELRKIWTIRLETLRHPSMTKGNFSRNENGNIVLTDIRFTVNGDRIPITSATASFNQRKFPIAHAIDADSASGWALLGGLQHNQHADFRLKSPLSLAPGAHIEAELAFNSPHPGHVLGSFRLSASADIPTGGKALAMIMKEQPRKTHILKQGLFDQPGAEVSPRTPAVLPAFADFAPNRLGLARWLTAPENPLFARVAVNRLWQQFFGAGLVRTPDNFGMQGEQPTHPDLLDWLAVEFRESGWDWAHLIRTIANSATYRQASARRPDIDDPANRLLARGPSFRLPAELIRDQALSVSGLLNPQVGGPSVRPYQPAGVWEDLNAPKSHAEVYRPDRGPDLYRKSLYIYWRRAALHPAMATFDAPSRDVCAVERASTNTPLQALAIQHDPTYIEAARKLAERLLPEPDPIQRGFRSILSRAPTSREQQLLRDLHATRLAHYRKSANSATQLLSVGESPSDPKLDPVALAALADTLHTVLNLSETITRK
ncbi:MAG: hypothetical protein ACI8W8_001663 [Rhodothermales bacterium]|jgi:hypothetical protein